MVEKPHPNIYELIEDIKEEEATTRMKMQLFESESQLPPRRRTVREKERRVQALFDRWNTGAMSTNDFLSAIKGARSYYGVRAMLIAMYQYLGNYSSY